MIFKIINDSIDFNELIFTLFVFDVYSRIIEMNASFFIIIQRAVAMKKTMNEVRKHIASRQIKNAFNIRNESSTISIRDFSLNSKILIFRENIENQADAWKESYKFFDLKNEAVIIEFLRKSTRFRIIIIKSYYRSNNAEKAEHSSLSIDEKKESENSIDQISFIFIDRDDSEVIELSNVSNIESSVVQSIKRDRERSRKFSVQINFVIQSDICFLMNNFDFMFDDFFDDVRDYSNHFLIEISFQFIVSKQKKIDELLKKKIFKFVNVNEIFQNIKIFNARFVNEIKNENTEKIFEKSRLIMQTYNDFNKNQVFTQSSIIQRMSQRLVVCITVVLEVNSNDSNNSTKLFFRNVIQTYVQSIFNLNREFYVKSFHEFVSIMKTSYDCILKIMKSLYEVFETNNHWFFIYHKHYIEKLVMIELTYDLYLFHSIESFGLIDLQTDDTLIFVSNDFVIKKNEAIKTINIMIKKRECFNTTNSIKFNDMKIEFQKNETIIIKHASYVKNISSIKNQNSSFISAKSIVRKKLISKNQYVIQRARDAYVISICQFEAFFDLAYAAQAINVISDDIALLNKRLTWQIENKSRKLKYVKLDFDSLRLMIFTDSFYVNNRNLIFQIDYVICLIDASNWINILHWSSIKCKRMIRSVLIFELYELIHEFDFETILKTTIERILRSNISLVVCTDFRFLYQCLMRLKTIEKKRLMIDVMSLRQSYERREITEIKWIDENSNSIDVMIKSKIIFALKILIDTNRINLTAIEWIERSEKDQEALNTKIEIECFEHEKKWNTEHKTIWLIKLISKDFFRNHETDYVSNLMIKNHQNWLCFKFDDQESSKLNITMKTCW